MNDDSITDPMLIAESRNEYFVNMGPSLASEASEDPIAQNTTNSPYDSVPITDTTFNFHPMLLTGNARE